MPSIYYSYPEILLMRAEANARLNKTSEANADLNYLRALRFKTGTPPLNNISDVIRWNPHWNIPLDNSPWSNTK